MSSQCLMRMDFQFGKIRKFWKWVVVMAAQQCECASLVLLTCTLKNGQKTKFYVMCILHYMCVSVYKTYFSFIQMFWGITQDTLGSHTTKYQKSSSTFLQQRKQNATPFFLAQNPKQHNQLSKQRYRMECVRVRESSSIVHVFPSATGPGQYCSSLRNSSALVSAYMSDCTLQPPLEAT